MDDVVKSAGAKLRDVRMKYGLTLEDVQQRSRERFREAGMVKLAHLSKIERGMLAKPPTMRMIASLAAVYNMQAETILEWYELPIFRVVEVAEPPVITRAKQYLRTLPPGDARREKLIALFAFALEQVRAGVV
jgi:transcriptional regulator with XRE-family HTH domain